MVRDVCVVERARKVWLCSLVLSYAFVLLLLTSTLAWCPYPQHRRVCVCVSVSFLPHLDSRSLFFVVVSVCSFFCIESGVQYGLAPYRPFLWHGFFIGGFSTSNKNLQQGPPHATDQKIDGRLPVVGVGWRVGEARCTTKGWCRFTYWTVLWIPCACQYCTVLVPVRCCCSNGRHARLLTGSDTALPVLCCAALRCA